MVTEVVGRTGGNRDVPKRTDRPFRVLSVDGGGIRGYYTVTLLHCLANHFAHVRRKPVAGLDVGKGFDLIVGTSTGGIIARGLAPRV